MYFIVLIIGILIGISIGIDLFIKYSDYKIGQFRKMLKSIKKSKERYERSKKIYEDLLEELKILVKEQYKLCSEKMKK